MKISLYIGSAVIVFLILASMASPLFLSFPPDMISDRTLSPPDSVHILGTTDLGEDVFSQLVHGILPTLYILFGVGFGTALISFTAGAVSAVFGGLTDRFLIRTSDVMLSMPSMIAIMLVVSLLSPGLTTLVFIFILFGWHEDMRIFRAKVKSEMNMEHILMAKTFGATHFYLIRRHLLPECTPLLFARSLQGARKAVFKMTGLSFLGLTDPSMISWGGMLHHSLPYIGLNAWKWWMLPPLFLLFITLLSLALIIRHIEHNLFSTP